MTQPPLAPAWAEALRWQLLPMLRKRGGLRLDMRASLNLEAWLDAALMRGWLTDDPACARGPVRAIMCKSAREQATFDAVFDGWLESWDRPAPPVEPPPGSGTDNNRAAIAERRQRERVRNIRRWLAGGTLTLLWVAAFYGYQAWQNRPLPAAAGAPAAESSPAASASGPVAMVLEVELPSAEAASAAEASATPRPATPVPAPAWLFGVHPGVYAALVLLAGTAGLAIRRTRQSYIQRITTRENLREQEVFVRQLLPVSGNRRDGLRRAVRQLRRADMSGALDLDILASVRASAARAGVFTAVHRQRPATPEFLLLVDRVRSGDQQAHWAIETARDLLAEGVRLTLYEFDRDPRWVAPLRSQRSSRSPVQQRYVPLATLAARHAGQGLLVLGDGHGLIDHRSGLLQPWLAPALAAWPRRVLMTPRPIASWGAAEDVLAGEGVAAHEASFLLVPSQFDAWLAAARWLRSGKLMALGPLPGAPAEWPPLLADDPDRWLGRVAPADAELIALVEQLRAFLGPTAFTWLAASAAYPLLSADLTAYLAHRLSDPALPGEAGAPSQPPDARLLEARLVAIAQLPWCRQGLMPDWLRRALLLSLPQATRRRVREVIRQLFLTAGDTRLSGIGWSLGQVATDAPAAAGTRLPLWRAIGHRIGLAGVLEAEPADSPLRDVIYLGVLRGEFDVELSLEATEQFARAARAEGAQTLSWNPLRWVAAGALTGWFVLSWLGWRARRAAYEGAALFKGTFGSRPGDGQSRAGAASAPVADQEAPSVERSAQLSAMKAIGEKLVRASIPNVYISYRRRDAVILQALRAQLERRFPGQLALDVNLIEPGADWAEALQRSISCQSQNTAHTPEAIPHDAHEPQRQRKFLCLPLRIYHASPFPRRTAHLILPPRQSSQHR